jgi:hypothetical protein
MPLPPTMAIRQRRRSAIEESQLPGQRAAPLSRRLALQRWQSASITQRD